MFKALALILLLNFFLIDVSDANVQQGLVAWYRFKEGAGTTVADSTANGNTGTLQNSPTWVAGRKDPYALTFNGSNQYVTITNLNPSSSLTGSYSVSVWEISTAANTDGWRPIIGDGGGNIFYVGSLSGVNSELNVHFDEGNVNIPGSYTLNDGFWHLVTVVVIPSTSITVYFDGNQVYQGGAGTGQGTTALAIGFDQRGEYWKGSVDDVRFYNRALSPQEILQLYNPGAQFQNAVIRNAHINQ